MDRRSFLKFGAKAAVVAPIALVACSAPTQDVSPLSMAMRLKESHSLLNINDTEHVKRLKPTLVRVAPGQRYNSRDFNQLVDAIEDLRLKYQSLRARQVAL